MKSLFLLFILQLLALCVHENEANENSLESVCCSLEWLAVSRENLTKAIAIESDGENIYSFILMDGVSGEQEASFIKWSRTNPNCSFVDVLEPKNPLVLANPNECSLQWTDSKEGKMDRYYVPEVSEAIFVRSLRKQRQNGVDRSKIVPRFWPTRPGRINKTVNEGCTGKNEVCTDENTEYLRVDCLQSMKSVLEPQLVSIELDSSSFGPSQREVIHVKKHKNNGEDVSLYTFDAIAPISLLFQYKLKGYRVPFEKYLKNETNVATFRENLSNSLLQKLFNWPEAEAFLPRLNSNASDLDGRFSVDVHFKRQVLIPDHTECEIASYIDWITLPNPTNATVKFSIAPVSKFKKFWTNSRILSFLKQRNIDRSQLREENDKLTFKFDAELFAKFFIDAKVDDPICEKS